MTTVAARASGRRSAVELNPNSFTDATWSQRSKGILSTDTPAAGSAAPTKKLCQLSDMLRTAASHYGLGLTWPNAWKRRTAPRAVMATSATAEGQAASHRGGRRATTGGGGAGGGSGR